MLTGIHNETFNNLQLNAGAFVRDFDYTQYKDKAALKTAFAALLETGEGLLGMTRGGGTFQCTPTLRNIEGDGLRSPFVGGTVNDGWTVKLTGTLLEITPENFAAAMMCADKPETSGNATTIKLRTAIKREDYITKICWIGDTSQGYMLIELQNALNVTGANFTFTDKGEGTLPFEFQAHQANATNQDYAPCTVVFLT
jgi:hypothetical protein